MDGLRFRAALALAGTAIFLFAGLAAWQKNYYALAKRDLRVKVRDD